MRLQGPVGQGRTAVSTRVPQWVSLVTTHSCPSGRYDPDHVCNASDTAGRYSYSKQPEVCKWNLQKLAEALDPALPLELAEAILAEEFDAEFGRHYLQKMRRKLGLVQTEQEGDGVLVAQLLETMHLTGEWGRAAHGPWLSGSVSRPLGLPLQGVCDFLADPARRPSAAQQKWPAGRPWGKHPSHERAMSHRPVHT